MSIILKGIDLPKEGEHIVALVKSNGKCSYWEQDTEYGICEPMQTVEAIHIDRPHGRLIDADETRTQYYQTMDELLQSTTINISVEALSLLCGFTLINNAPTILEAEE